MCSNKKQYFSDSFQRAKEFQKVNINSKFKNRNILARNYSGGGCIIERKDLFKLSMENPSSYKYFPHRTKEIRK